MANINVRKDMGAQQSSPSAALARLEPFRALRELLSWDPFVEMAPLAPHTFGGFAPPFEVKETQDAYVFSADVPGVKQADLQVTVTGNRLSISGKREAEHQEKADAYYTYECSYGEFSRGFTLPDGADTAAVSADLKDGVLTVSVRKSPALQPKKVTIQTPAKRS